MQIGNNDGVSSKLISANNHWQVSLMSGQRYFLTLGLAISLWLNGVNATVTNTPHLNGPIFPVVPQSVPGAKRSAGEFVHPGLWHTHSNLETIRNNVLNGVDPWKSAYEQFSIDSYSQANYTMRGPAAVLSRGTISNYTSFTSDVRAAYQNALMCMSMDGCSIKTRRLTIPRVHNQRSGPLESKYHYPRRLGIRPCRYHWNRCFLTRGSRRRYVCQCRGDYALGRGVG